MTRVFVLLALLWHIVVPRAIATPVAAAPQLRAAQSSVVSPAIERPTAREAARSRGGDAAPPAFTPAAATIVVTPASFTRLAAPRHARSAEPDPLPFAPTARGPPTSADS